MATTTKKSAAKKTTAKTKTAAARPAATKAKPTVARKTTDKKTVRKTAAAPSSFRQTSEPVPFMTFKPTVQTVYWLILGVLVLSLGAWVMYLNVKIQEIYDQIDMNTTAINTVVDKPVKNVIHR